MEIARLLILVKRLYIKKGSLGELIIKNKTLYLDISSTVTIMRTKQAFKLLAIAGFVVLGLATSTTSNRMGHGNVKQGLAQKLHDNVQAQAPKAKVLIEAGAAVAEKETIEAAADETENESLRERTPPSPPPCERECDCDLHVSNCGCLSPNVRPCVASVPPLTSSPLGWEGIESSNQQFQANQATNIAT